MGGGVGVGGRGGRVFRQLGAESMVLTLTGAGLGLLFANSITGALLALMPVEIPRVHAVDLNLAVLGFAVGLALLTGLLFGIVPALAASRTNVNNTLKEGGRSGMQSREHNRVRAALVVV